MENQQPGGRLATIARVLEAWRLSPTIHELEPGANDAAIAAAGTALGRPLPEGLRALLRSSNGFAALSGNLMVEPITGSEDGGIVGLGDRLRSWDWPIPEELLMFGNNGGGDQFGLWYPTGADADGPTPVVMVGEIFEPASLALAGTDLSTFLLAWSGYYLVLLEAPNEALEALGLPDGLRDMDDEAGPVPYFRWADPALADPDPNPYERALDAAGIAALVDG